MVMLVPFSALAALLLFANDGNAFTSSSVSRKVSTKLSLSYLDSLSGFTQASTSSSSSAAYSLGGGGGISPLPPSVHAGVVTGQAQVDLLNHAKENGA